MFAIKRVCATVRNKAANVAAALLVVFGLAGAASASDPLIQDTGINVGAFIIEGISAMGSVVAVAVGGYFAFLIVKLAMRWGRAALRG